MAGSKEESPAATQQEPPSKLEKEQAPAAEKDPTAKVQKEQSQAPPEEALQSGPADCSAEAASKQDVAPTASTSAAEPGTSELPVAAEPPVDDSTYGIHVDAESAFDTARMAAQTLHQTLGVLKLSKEDGEAASDVGGLAFSKTAHDLQLQLLALRRAHRAMAKVAEIGRVAEASARRVADAEYAHLETRRYESACCRAAARRCRTFPTPQLSKVRPWLDGRSGEPLEEEEEEDEDKDGEDASLDGKPMVTSLSKRLQTEQEERTWLAQELERFEKAKASAVAEFRERDQFSADLAKKMQAAELALEPVCDILELRPHPRGTQAQAVPVGVELMPTPLRLLFSKFQALSVADGGVAVELEDFPGGTDASKVVAVEPSTNGEPPAKKPRLASSGAVRVSIASSPGKDAEVVLRFSCAPAASAGGNANSSTTAAEAAAPCLIGVSCEADADAGDGVIESLWLDDDGRAGALPSAAEAANLTGRAYGWAQVLAGLRERSLSILGSAGGCSGGPLASGTTVAASDVVQRVRAALVEASGP